MAGRGTRIGRLSRWSEVAAQSQRFVVVAGTLGGELRVFYFPDAFVSDLSEPLFLMFEK